LHPFPEGRDPYLSFRVLFCEVHEYSDPSQTVGLLRPCRERPGNRSRRRAAEQLDELATSHAIT
jgi:hypothetical protein